MAVTKEVEYIHIALTKELLADEQDSMLKAVLQRRVLCSLDFEYDGRLKLNALAVMNMSTTTASVSEYDGRLTLVGALKCARSLIPI